MLTSTATEYLYLANIPALLAISLFTLLRRSFILRKFRECHLYRNDAISLQAQFLSNGKRKIGGKFNKFYQFILI